MSTMTVPATPQRSQSGGAATGTRPLLALAWRRDRIMIPLAWAGLVALSVGSAQATRALYPDAAAAQGDLAVVIDNPSVVALYGPVAAPTLDALAVFKTVMLGAFLVSVLGLVVVRRHTRAEEEEGRLELLESGAVTRRAPLTAALILAVVAVLVPSGVSALGLIAVGQDPWGSVAFGAAWAAAGLGTVGITAVAVQLAATSRTASGLAYGTLAVGYVLRAIGDSNPDSWRRYLSWFSPLGWAGEVRAYGENRLGVLLFAIAVSAAAIVLSYVLLDRRDLGGGLIAARSGPGHAGADLSTVLGLSARLARGTFIGWSIGMLVAAVVIASLIGSVAALAANQAVAEILASLGGSAGTLADIFLSAELRIIAVAVAAAAVGLAVRLASAERAGFAEAVLATATSRASWFAAHAAVAMSLPVVLMGVLGLVLAALSRPVAGAVAPGPGAMLGACLATLPAIWVCVAAALALVGLSPRWAPLAWVILLFAFVVGELGPTMRLPQWLVGLSPFDHLSQLPGGVFDLGSTLGLCGAAVALAAVGWWGLRRRDIG